MLGVTLRDTARDIVSRHGPAKGGKRDIEGISPVGGYPMSRPCPGYLSHNREV